MHDDCANGTPGFSPSMIELPSILVRKNPSACHPAGAGLLSPGSKVDFDHRTGIRQAKHA
jgi:hypothetical protein